MAAHPYASRPVAASHVWLTPPEILAALGPFDLDPCASTQQPWPCAKKSYTYHDDGLRQPWEGMVWLNPPYGPHAQRWLNKLAEHGTGIALVPARTETRWFFSQVWGKASALYFPEGRLSFLRPDGRPGIGNSGHSSVFVAYGDECAARLLLTRMPGGFVEGWK